MTNSPRRRTRGRRALHECRWRVGRKVGRTIYAIVGDDPSDGDVLVGVMDSKALANAAVDAHNTMLESTWRPARARGVKRRAEDEARRTDRETENDDTKGPTT